MSYRFCAIFTVNFMFHVLTVDNMPYNKLVAQRQVVKTGDKNRMYKEFYGTDKFEGDIELSQRQKASLKFKNAISFAEIWPNGVIPYVIDESVADLTTFILHTQEHIQTMTSNCIKFVPRNQEPDFVSIIRGYRGCWSAIGKLGGRQELHLARNCDSIGVIMHELLHTVGFYHEHTRPDRDKYVKIYPENINSSLLDNFEIFNGLTTTKFDYDSIMIYGEYAFTKQQGRKTMEAKDKRYKLRDPYDKKTLTKLDVTKIITRYRCNNVQ